MLEGIKFRDSQRNSSSRIYFSRMIRSLLHGNNAYIIYFAELLFASVGLNREIREIRFLRTIRPIR